MPQAQFDTLISPADCRRVLDSALLLDCRARLGDADWGRKAYDAGHIPGALHADLDRDLAAPPGAGGRHPLPDRALWQATLRGWGLNPGRQVVAYDDAGGAFAARCWWLLRWAGHAAAAVLDGGLPNWLQHYPDQLQTEIPAVQPSSFTLSPPLDPVVEADELLADLERPDAPLLVDARTRPRWAGLEEPIDPVAGHIPGALCLPFQENLDANGCFKPPAALAERFAPVLAAPASICYCGSGVTAAHNLLALHIAGHTRSALYPESWSGWISDPRRPVATSTSAASSTHSGPD